MRERQRDKQTKSERDGGAGGRKKSKAQYRYHIEMYNNMRLIIKLIIKANNNANRTKFIPDYDNYNN